MSTVTHPDPIANTVSGRCYGCPAGCDLPTMTLSWPRYRRSLRADLAAAQEVIDALLDVAWRAA
jgi:hypothetical protein